LETALNLIHINKDSLRRVGGFIEYPDKMVEFFELVHIADLIQQMVQVYYDEEMANNKYVNKADFLNICNKEKKIFEKILDDCVASGLNKGIQVLIDQVEFILITEQLPENFRPIDTLLDLKPTKACLDAVECLSTYTKLVLGCTDKNTLDVFFQEIGLRLFGEVIGKCFNMRISISGGNIDFCFCANNIDKSSFFVADIDFLVKVFRPGIDCIPGIDGIVGIEILEGIEGIAAKKSNLSISL
ncbi:13625_t:CDS:2, partial [Entrophospora sp. SA101]